MNVILNNLHLRNPDHVTAMTAATNAGVNNIMRTLKSLIEEYKLDHINVVRLVTPSREKFPTEEDLEQFTLHTRAKQPPTEYRSPVEMPMLNQPADSKKRKTETKVCVLSDLANELDNIDEHFANVSFEGLTKQQITESRKKMKELHKRANALKRALEHATFSWHKTNVIVCTLSALHDERLKNTYFDNILVDEAGQPRQAIILQAITRLSTSDPMLMLLGDRHQLPPMVVTGGQARQMLSESVLERLEQQQIVSNHRLNICYRLPPVICAFVSNETYSNQLDSNWTKRDNNPNRMVPTAHLNCPLTIIAVESQSTSAGTSYVNNAEADIVTRLYSMYVKNNDNEAPDLSQLRVLSMYEKQRTLITSKVSNNINQHRSKRTT